MEPLDVAARVAAGQDGVLTARQAIACGVHRTQVRDLCRAGRWRRLARGSYLVDADVVGPPARRAVIRAAVASAGPGAVAVLDTAAEMWGIAGLRRTALVHVSVPPDSPRAQRRRHPDIVVHQLGLRSADVTSVAGIPATTPVVTVADVIRRVERYSAVALLDSALNTGRLGEADVAAIPRLIQGRRGAVAARGVLAEADGRAQSPLETMVRLRCVDGGVPPDDLQVEVRDPDGYLLGVGDLGWRAAKVIAEADGAGPHGLPAAVYQDRQRQNRLVNAGWLILRFTWHDAQREDYIPYTVRTALNRQP